MRVFADTHFYLGLLSVRDAAHGAASRWQKNKAIREVVTTSWVLLELADAMHLPHEREVAARFIDALRAAPQTRIVPASEDLLWRGLDLYRSRSDKAWSLTDCLSFVVMAEEGLAEALTGDRTLSRRVFGRCWSHRFRAWRIEKT